MTKRIKLMAEYRTFPLWSLDEGGGGPIDPSTLPLTQETIRRLLEWAHKYDAQLNSSDFNASQWFSDEEISRFDEEGIALWLQMQEELGTRYDVWYFSERLRRLLKHPDELGS